MNGINRYEYPLVSVIINCFNSHKYLNEAIDSVLSQTYNNWQIIFWDNQSTDNSASILKNYTDSRIKYFLSPIHTSLGEARNAAVKNADGEWLAFLDCDDVWYEDKLQLQIDKIIKSKYPLSLIYGTTIFFSDENIRFVNITRSNLPEGNVFEELVKENFISLSSALVLKSKYWEVGGINNKYKQSEDYDLFAKISFNAFVGAIDEPIVKNRIHNNNLSKFQKDLAFTESIEILHEYLPDTRAYIGLRFWSSFYMLFCLKRLKFTKDALHYFYNYGSIKIMLKLIKDFSI